MVQMHTLGPHSTPPPVQHSACGSALSEKLIRVPWNLKSQYAISLKKPIDFPQLRKRIGEIVQSIEDGNNVEKTRLPRRFCQHTGEHFGTILLSRVVRCFPARFYPKEPP